MNKLGLLIFIFFPICCFSQVIDLAVISFKALPSNKTMESLTESIIENSLLPAFSEIDNIQLIERDLLPEILGELDLQQSNYVDKSTMVELKKLIGVKKAIIGKVFKESNVIFLSIRVVDIETGRIDPNGMFKGEYKYDTFSTFSKKLHLDIYTFYDLYFNSKEPSIKISGLDGHLNYFKELQNSPSKRIIWFSELSQSWKKMFNLYLGNGEILSCPNDKELYKLINLDSLEVGKYSGLIPSFELYDLSGIECLLGLTYFKLSYQPIGRLEGLMYLKNLETIDISNCPLVDLIGIVDVNNSDYLKTADKGITVYHVLSSNTNLKELRSLSLKSCGHYYIHGYFIDNLLNISGIDCLKSLKSLSLKFSKLRDSDLIDVFKLDSLTNLSLLGCDIQSVKGIEELKMINELDIAFNPRVKGLKLLNKLPNLTVLHADKCELSNVKFLQECSSIVELSLRNNNIKDAEGLMGLVNLQRLSISDNRLKSIEFIILLNKLRSVDLHNNSSIQDIERICKSSSLEYAYIDDIMPSQFLESCNFLLEVAK